MLLIIIVLIMSLQNLLLMSNYMLSGIAYLIMISKATIIGIEWNVVICYSGSLLIVHAIFAQ